jgi:hypothetical protein
MARRLFSIPFGREFLLAAFSVALTLGAAELTLRALLFVDTPISARLRHPGLYADYFSDNDYWILQYVFKHRRQPPENPHPLLGWVGTFDRETYRHDQSAETAGRRPVLMYGDSFTRCAYSEKCFEDILNADEEFAMDHALLNYGVGGYGLGQIYLLLKNSLDHYPDPIVVVGFMTFDLDRSILSVRTGQKPRFVAEDGQLELTNVPIAADPADWFEVHPPTLRSYVAAALKRQARKHFPTLMRDADIEAQKMEVNRLILTAIEEELQSRDLDRIYVVFHPNWAGVATLDASTDWRDPFLRKFFEDRAIPFVWSKEIVQRDREARSASWDDYIGVKHGHPTTRYNELVSQEIKKSALRARPVQPLDNAAVE